MVLQWFTGNKAARAGGRHGVVAILADVSGSMDIATLTTALRAVARAVPSARVFVFACTVQEAPRIRDGEGLPDVGGLSNMEIGLAAVAELRPKHTIVLSDGHVDTLASLAIADSMTGAISTLWFGSFGTANCGDTYERQFMRELARKGGGQFREYDFARGANALAEELLNIVRVQRIHYHELSPVHVHHGHGTQQGGEFAPTTVRVRRGGR